MSRPTAGPRCAARSRSGPPPPAWPCSNSSPTTAGSPSHLHPDDADALPGWHAVHGGIAGWGTGDRHGAVQDWMLARPLLPQLAPAFPDGFDRDRPTGLSLLFGSGASRESAEVRVNGAPHEGASKALLALDWPRVAEGTAFARTFVLLTRPQDG
ncbi:DUF6348 family protein [Kitasatospora arboriphila]